MQQIANLRIAASPQVQIANFVRELAPACMAGWGASVQAGRGAKRNRAGAGPRVTVGPRPPNLRRLPFFLIVVHFANKGLGLPKKARSRPPTLLLGLPRFGNLYAHSWQSVLAHYISWEAWRDDHKVMSNGLKFPRLL
jgi:hypothetical protein